MSQVYEFPDSPVTPLSVSAVKNITSDLVTTSEILLNNSSSLFLSPRDDALLVSPRRVSPNALEEFKSDLHEIIPSLKDITDEDLERLIGDRNTDEVDD